MHPHFWTKPCSCVAQRILSYIGNLPKEKHGIGKHSYASMIFPHSHASMIFPRNPYIFIQKFERPYIYIYTYIFDCESTARQISGFHTEGWDLACSSTPASSHYIYIYMYICIYLCSISRSWNKTKLYDSMSMKWKAHAQHVDMMPGFILSIAVLGHQIADYIIITVISDKLMKKKTSQHRVCAHHEPPRQEQPSMDDPLPLLLRQSILKWRSFPRRLIRSMWRGQIIYIPRNPNHCL